MSSAQTGFILSLLFYAGSAAAQGCCSGGSGSPIAGGAAQGVLAERQVELSVNQQFMSTSRFYTGERDTAALFDRLTSNYLYGRVACGVTQRFTISLESGYYVSRRQYGLSHNDTVSSGGIADLIIFPRYTILQHNTERTRTEITLGAGMKIPVGKYNDSTMVYRNPISGTSYYTVSPPTVQPTNESQDFIFYGFVYRGYVERKMRFFANFLYLRRGWNPLGQKFGDYCSVGLFAGTSLWKNLSLTVQARGEYMAPMQYHRFVDMLALYNIDVNSTGSRKVFLSPQVGYTVSGFTLYALYEFPVYQFLNGTQVGSEHMATAGLSYRFFAY